MHEQGISSLGNVFQDEAFVVRTEVQKSRCVTGQRPEGTPLIPNPETFPRVFLTHNITREYIEC